jgi:hypothetical protein
LCTSHKASTDGGATVEFETCGLSDTLGVGFNLGRVAGDERVAVVVGLAVQLLADVGLDDLFLHSGRGCNWFVAGGLGLDIYRFFVFNFRERGLDLFGSRSAFQVADDRVFGVGT